LGVASKLIAATEFLKDGSAIDLIHT